MLTMTEICEDIQEECQKYGQIVEMKIPRPSGGSRQSAGVGKIFLKYDTPATAKKALDALAGRQFANRTVVVTYFDEVSNADFLKPQRLLIVSTGKLRCQCVVEQLECCNDADSLRYSLQLRSSLMTASPDHELPCVWLTSRCVEARLLPSREPLMRNRILSTAARV